MEDKINTIRSALTAAANLIAHQYTGTSLGMTALQDASDDCLGALAALAQLEAMAGEQEPVAWRVKMICCGKDEGFQLSKTWDQADAFRNDYTSGYGVELHGFSAPEHSAGHRRAAIVEALYAAPVAPQQEPVKPCCMNFAAGTNCFSDPRIDCPHLPTFAQQPQFVECSYGADGYACCEGGPCAADTHNDKVAQQLEDFEEGQWWRKELDAMVKDGTPDQKRAVAVVRNLMATAKAPQQVEDEPYMYISRNQFEKNHAEPEGASGRYLPVRKTPAGKFTCPLYLKPQQAERVEEDIAWGIAWGTHGDRTCVSIIKKHPDGITEVVASEYEPAANVARKTPQQAEAVPLLTDKERRELLDHTGRNAEGLDGETWDQMVIDAVEAAVRAKLLLNETGYAGVKVWVGDKQVVRIVSEAELQHEVVPGRALVNAAIQTIAAVQEAHVDN